MKTKTIWIITALIVSSVASFTLFRTNLETIVKLSIEEIGELVFEVPVSVEKVTIDKNLGLIEIQKIKFGNPAGFYSDLSLYFEKVEVDIKSEDWSLNPIEIESVKFINPKIVFEKKGQHNNLAVLYDSASRYQFTDPDDENPRKIIIKEFLLGEGQLQVRLGPIQAQKLTQKTPEILIENIGGDSEGATPNEIKHRIRKEIQSKAGSIIQKLRQ